MDALRFDQLTRQLLGERTRRAIFGRIAALSLAGPLGLWVAHDDAEAKKQRTRKQKKRKQKAAAPNAFGCIDVGALCQNNDQCCSGICAGKKGKKRCRAHDTGGCSAGHDAFGDDAVTCQTSSGAWGKCGTTTGNAGYCVGGGDCHPCAKDADCRSLCGPQAACVVSPQTCAIGTACVAPNGAYCLL